MAQKLYEESNIQAIADAIRTKNGTTNTYKTSEMAAAITAIESGGGDPIVTTEDLVLNGDMSYGFAYGRFDWLINKFGDKITTYKISNARHMFSGAGVESIPFDLNFEKNLPATSLFKNCAELKAAPKINSDLSGATNSSVDISELFSGCHNLKYVDNVFNEEDLEPISSIVATGTYSTIKCQSLFNNCYSLRRVPSWLSKIKCSEDSTAYPAKSYNLYSALFALCRTLDEVVDLNVQKCSAALTFNLFDRTFEGCYRVKNITFETNDDGTPFTVQWGNQIIDLTASVGYKESVDPGWFTDYNSGITLDKHVTDDATYQALKDDPDWFTTNIAYSRYNHDSAVATINSLPDTSAYLATAGGTNTIKFKGVAGSATDGGAIETLTAEEIAVATAKGWTVQIV